MFQKHTVRCSFPDPLMYSRKHLQLVKQVMFSQNIHIETFKGSVYNAEVSTVPFFDFLVDLYPELANAPFNACPTQILVYIIFSLLRRRFRWEDKLALLSEEGCQEGSSHCVLETFVLLNKKYSFFSKTYFLTIKYSHSSF